VRSRQGSLVVVQTGDEIDRGDDDRAILDLVEALKKQASAAGGELVALLGNHEIMNASLDFRYVTGGGFAAFPATPVAVPCWPRWEAASSSTAASFPST
jgi:hypothetical protein